MATKKATASAPASKKRAAREPGKKRAAPAKKSAALEPGRTPGYTYDGRPNRAEKSAVNKATRVSATAFVNNVRAEVKDIGRRKVVIDAPQLPPYNGWTPEVEQALYDLIGTGHSMREIATIPGMPRLIDMLSWLTDDTHVFSTLYARARQAVATLYEEEIQRIGTSPQRGRIKVERQQLTKDGDLVDTVETRCIDNVERSKLAVATLQWTLGHLKPRKHGPRPEAEQSSGSAQLEGLFASLKAGPVDTPPSKK
jgi:hypothetical protein